MTEIFRAPELSATSNIERIWIMVLLRRWSPNESRPATHGPPLDLRRLGNHARHDPPLAPAERPRLGDHHRVPDFRLVALVMSDELRGLALALAVHLVAHLSLDRDHDGLLHLVADDGAGHL